MALRLAPGGMITVTSRPVAPDEGAKYPRAYPTPRPMMNANTATRMYPTRRLRPVPYPLWRALRRRANSRSSPTNEGSMSDHSCRAGRAAPLRSPARVARRAPRGSSGGLLTSTPQIVLEQGRRRPRVARGASTALVGELRCEAFVVQRDGDVDGGGQARRERAGSRRLSALRSVERHRQTDHDAFRGLVREQLQQRREPHVAIHVRDHGQGPRQRAARVGDGHAGAHGTVIQRKDAHSGLERLADHGKTRFEA